MSTSISCVDVSFSLPAPGVCDLLPKSRFDDPLLKSFSSSSSPSSSALFSFNGGLRWFCDRLYVPPFLCLQIPSACNNSASVDYPGLASMLSLVSRTFSWPTLHPDVMLFVKSCDSCQCTCIDTQSSQGHLVPPSIPDCPWIHIGVDFIVKHLLSSGFDSIFVVVDHFSEGTHFIPCNSGWTLLLLLLCSFTIPFVIMVFPIQ